MLVGDGTCWRNPVQATEMWRVTLKVKWQADRSDGTTNAHIQRHVCIHNSSWGISGHKLTVNHTLTYLTTKHANTFSHSVSHHFGSTSSGNEWWLCFTDELTHLWRRWGNFGCFKLCTTSCRKTWVNTVLFFFKAPQGEPGLPCVGMCWLYQVKTKPCRMCGSPRETNISKVILKEAFFYLFIFHPTICGCVKSVLTKNGLYPAGATAGTAPRGPAAGGSTGSPEEKIPRAFRFKPGIRLACCCGEEKKLILVTRKLLQIKLV